MALMIGLTFSSYAQKTPVREHQMQIQKRELKMNDTCKMMKTDTLNKNNFYRSRYMHRPMMMRNGMGGFERQPMNANDTLHNGKKDLGHPIYRPMDHQMYRNRPMMRDNQMMFHHNMPPIKPNADIDKKAKELEVAPPIKKKINIKDELPMEEFIKYINYKE